MTKPFADSAAHNSIPDMAIPCILARRHLGFPPLHEQARELVRVRYGTGRTDYVDFIEYRGKCRQCGTERIMRRARGDNSFAQAWYEYGEGYAAPEGTVWDRASLYEIYSRRHPVQGKPRIIDAR